MRFQLLAGYFLMLLIDCEGFMLSRGVLSRTTLFGITKTTMSTSSRSQWSTPSKKKAKPHQLVTKWLKSEIVPTLVKPVVDIHAEGDNSGVDLEECTLHKMERVLRTAQKNICAIVEELDGSAGFEETDYTLPNSANSHLAIVGGTLQKMSHPRVDGGGGRRMLLHDGNVFDRSGVQTSVVYGELRDGMKLVPYASAGLNVILRPTNPTSPTLHCNYRYVETAEGSWWFSGATDMSTGCLDDWETEHYHGVHKAVCDAVDTAYYQQFRANGNAHFSKHRRKNRAHEEISFDQLNDRPAEALLGLVEGCLQAATEVYMPVIRNRGAISEQDWMQSAPGQYEPMVLTRSVNGPARKEGFLPPAALSLLTMSPTDLMPLPVNGAAARGWPRQEALKFDQGMKTSVHWSCGPGRSVW
mmetsp:Transcript_11481/g.23671  ORF Transcript_11481/g.23671 Transcript_11481/m.23671 type:complete len:413 (-) Transcript_11481:256-1494(-)